MDSGRQCRACPRSARRELRVCAAWSFSCAPAHVHVWCLSTKWQHVQRLDMPRLDAGTRPLYCPSPLLQALLKAARDPRIVGVCLKISPLQAGWAKLQELRQYIKYFRCST